MQIISIIRNRGQLTLPQSIRNLVTWVNPDSVVSLTVIQPDQIVIKPHSQLVNWDQVWNNIKKSRAIAGKGKVETSRYIASDRANH